MSFNTTWPRALRFGCLPYGGLQLKHIEVEALIRKLRSIHYLLHTDDTSKAVKLLFHWYKYMLLEYLIQFWRIQVTLLTTSIAYRRMI